MWSMIMWVPAAIWMLAALPLQVRAQQRAINGVVRDSATTRPIIGALVTLTAGQIRHSTRTEDDGSFRFTDILPGEFGLTVRRLGFQAWSRLVVLGESDEPYVVELTRIAGLDTVRVRATRQGIYGVVGSSYDLKPLPFATVQVLGTTTKRVQADSNGQFYVPVTAAGSYVVRASAKGHVSQMMSTALAHDVGVELAFMLDSTSASTHWLDASYSDFASRMLRRRGSSALVSRSELRSNEGELIDLIRRAPSFGAKALRFGELACVFVDGRAQPGLALSAINPADIEAIEVYTAGADGGTLGHLWPRRFPCADTGVPRGARPRPDDVLWVVVWKKR